jgi:hypothetical protein
MMAVACPVAGLEVKLYIAEQQSAALGGYDSAQEIGAAITVLLPWIDNMNLCAGARDQALRRNQLSGPDAD